MSNQGEKAMLEEESMAYTGVNIPIFSMPPQRHAPKEHNNSKFRREPLDGERECIYY